MMKIGYIRDTSWTDLDDEEDWDSGKPEFWTEQQASRYDRYDREKWKRILYVELPETD